MNPSQVRNWAFRIFFIHAAALSFSGCGSYEFKKALRDDGKYDLSRLIADLEKEKPEPLFDLTWIPFAHLDLTGFSREPSEIGPSASAERSSWSPTINLYASGDYPPGYRLAEADAWGPLGAYLSERNSLYDDSGTGYEVVEMQALFWRLWLHVRTLVKTPHGTREESRHDLLFGLLPVHQRVRYSGPEGGGARQRAKAPDKLKGSSSTREGTP